MSVGVGALDDPNIVGDDIFGVPFVWRNVTQGFGIGTIFLPAYVLHILTQFFFTSGNKYDIIIKKKQTARRGYGKRMHFGRENTFKA